MRSEAWPHARAWAILLALTLLLPAASAGPVASPQPSSLDKEPASTEAVDLAAPLVKLAATPAEVQRIQAANAAGQAWSQAQLAEDASVADAVEDLYTALPLDVAASPAARPVPGSFEAPLATLLTLQANHAAEAGPFASLSTDAGHAFTLGALDPVIAAFEEARKDAPEEPVFVDPLGLIVIGGSGNDTYKPNFFATSWSKGPLLLVEPAGGEDYRVPLAAPTSFTAVRDAPVDLGIRFQFASLALDLGGHDSYNDRTASADLGGPGSQAVLVDRHGNDTYGRTAIERTTAHASPGFAYLLDEEGDDAYYAAKEGIAHAFRGGTAVLWDERGDDLYEAWDDSVNTHAVADSRQADALLWDEEGDDEYEADRNAFAFVANDGVARFVDEKGQDAYRAFSPGSSFAIRYLESFRLIGDSTVNRGLAEFIDGNGTDVYDFHAGSDNAMPPANGKTRVDHRDDRRWGVFIDCETPADAHRPCEDEQHQTRCTMLRHPYDVPGAVEPVLPVVLDPVEDECRGLGP